MLVNPPIFHILVSSAYRRGFGLQLRSALSRLNNNGPFLARFLPTNPLDLLLATLAQKVKPNAVIFVRFNQRIKSVFELEELHLLQLTLEDTILHPLAKVFQRFEDATSAFIVGDVV